MMDNIRVEEKQGVRLAVEGCGHGTLHAIYASIEEACRRKGWPGIDLLIIGGDFQSVRNAYDLNCVSMPAKYREMCDFHEYYSGQRRAPYLTVFVGGNHEASNYLFELYYGGWVAPNIYYMGASNVLRLGPLRIAGLSGIWKGYNYRKPHHERLPYSENDLKSIYHVREMDVRKLLQIRTQVDIGVSHDWPKGVEWKGNWKHLFRIKKFFEEDARNGQLGSVAAQQVLEWLRPRKWFSAHLHCKYVAVVEHVQSPNEHDLVLENEEEISEDHARDRSGHSMSTRRRATENQEELNVHPDGTNNKVAASATTVDANEIDLELEDDVDGIAPVTPGQGLDGVEVVVGSDPAQAELTFSAQKARAALPASFARPQLPPPQQYKPSERPEEIANKVTEFLALDKCMPNRDFLQLLSIPSAGAGDDLDEQRPLELKYDMEWLAITRVFALQEPQSLGDLGARVPPARSQNEYKTLIDEQISWIDKELGSKADLKLPHNFVITAPVFDGGNWLLPQYSQATEFPNPQTQAFCDMLQIPNAFAIDEEERMARMEAGPRVESQNTRSGRGNRGRGSFGDARFGNGLPHGRGGRGQGRGDGRGGRRGRGRPRGA
nr:lariat debranching enzyme [Quercus suber]